MTLPYRRAGHHESAPTPLRARRAIELSTRTLSQPDRITHIRGLDELAEAYQQTEAYWRNTWAEELKERGGRR